MNFEYFIARHIAPGRSEAYSRPVIRIAYISIALGLALMIASVAIVVGFKKSIREKITGFATPLQVVAFDRNQSVEETPIIPSEKLLKLLKSDANVAHVQLTAQKAGVLKTKDQIQGVVLKGVGTDYDWSFLKDNLLEGSLPDFHNGNDKQVLISRKLSHELMLKVGDPVRLWFVGGDGSEALGRKLIVSGIYHTGMEEFDKRYVIGALQQVQKLNGWKPDQVGNVEIELKDFSKINQTAQALYNQVPYNMTVDNIIQEYPEIFNWLALLDTNVVVILVLMLVVASITMVSTLFILIIERTAMVGILKTLGSSNTSVRKIFLYKAAYIIGRGMFWGNFAGLLFYFIQYHFHVFLLDPQNYYVSYVPVELHPLTLLWLNLGTFLMTLLVLILPSYYITRIVPARALRYE
ncbi:MAG: ABC transporter permease [Bacteroidales bacterium]|nr:ABC transporter permease [Bacteroidales bacterium]